MPLSGRNYREKYRMCLYRAQHSEGAVATLWREIADTYRFLIALEEPESREELGRCQLAQR